MDTLFLVLQQHITYLKISILRYIYYRLRPRYGNMDSPEFITYQHI